MAGKGDFKLPQAGKQDGADGLDADKPAVDEPAAAAVTGTGTPPTPAVGFKLVNIGQAPLAVFSLGFDHAGILGQKEVTTLQPGEAFEAHSHWDMLRVKALPVPEPAVEEAAA